jgi:hypothetical protein
MDGSIQCMIRVRLTFKPLWTETFMFLFNLLTLTGKHTAVPAHVMKPYGGWRYSSMHSQIQQWSASRPGRLIFGEIAPTTHCM